MRYLSTLFGALCSAFMTAWLFNVHGDAHRAILALSSTVGALGGSWGYGRWKRLKSGPLV